MSITPGGGMHATVPMKPSALSGTAAGAAITLHWTDNSNNETGFYVQRLNGAGTYVTVVKVGAGVTKYTDTLAPVGTDTYEVRAFDSSGQSAASNSATIITVLPATSVTAKAVSSTSVQLTWSGDLGATGGYTVQRATSANGTWTTVGTTAAGVRNFTNTGVTAATTYLYRIVALGAGTATATSANVAVTTLKVVATVPPVVGSITPHFHRRVVS